MCTLYRQELESVTSRLHVCRSCEKGTESLPVAAAAAVPAPTSHGPCAQLQQPYHHQLHQAHCSLEESSGQQSQHNIEIPVR